MSITPEKQIAKKTPQTKQSRKKESDEKICYKLLCEVFIMGSYSSLTLGNALSDISPADRAGITRLFYGVIEESIQFDYIIAKLTDKSPQKPVSILLKMGLFMLRYMDIPEYAAVDKIVKLSKEVGKSGVSGFINAILRKSVTVELPKDNLSVMLSYPQWVVDRLLKRYESDFVLSMLLRSESPLKHIRRNSLKISEFDFEKKLNAAKQKNAKGALKTVSNGLSWISNENKNDNKSAAKSIQSASDSQSISPKIGLKNNEKIDRPDKCGYQKTALGYNVSADKLTSLYNSEYTFQSLASMLAVNAYLSGQKYNDILDVCSAPGGKSVYLKELCPAAEIVCNDVHPHRVELIKKYAARMGVNLKYSCKDATAINPEWLNGFDLVICDVPCSGLGVKSKPDILLNRHEGDLALLAAIQYDILSSSAAYVRQGGYLCYSTCTIFAEENEDVINRFLQSNDSFELCPITDKNIEDNNGMVNLYPAKYHSDAFFIARLRRK